MSNLLASLRSSANALDVLTQAAGVTQNNISNAGTAGYTRQRVRVEARAFDPFSGLSGGVQFGGIQNARDAYAEHSVRTQNGKSTAAEARSTSLTRLEQSLQLSSGDSIPTALNRLFGAFSAWAVAPDDIGSKQNIKTAGEGLASAFRGVAQQLDGLGADNANQIREVVDRVNRLTGRVREFNADIRAGATDDAGVDAGIHATLDELSADVDVQAMKQADGTFTLLLNGQHPILIGLDQYELSVSLEIPADATRPGAQRNAVLRVGEDVQDITSSLDGARLGALLEFRHETLAGVQGDSHKQGQLDELAEKIMNRLNAAWPPPAHPFFVAGASSVSIAHVLSVNPALTPAMLDAVEPGPPPVSNGKALQLAALANPILDSDKIDGLSFTTFYGKIAGGVGSKLNDAAFDRDSQAQLLAQAEAFRDKLSGVSLDEEALSLLEFQRAYEASARMVTVLDEMLQTAVNLGRS